MSGAPEANFHIGGLSEFVEADIRDSLSYKLGKMLRFEGPNVSYSGEYYYDVSFKTKEELIELSDNIVIATMHSENIRFSENITQLSCRY